MSFNKTRVYQSHQMEEAYENEINLTKQNINKRSHIIIGMVGYSSLKNDQVELWWATTNQYEEICSEIYLAIIEAIKDSFPNTEIMSIDGASDMWIDKVLIDTRLKNDMKWLSFTCPEYIEYVWDIENNALLVSCDADTYLHNYSRCSDIMIVAGWRDSAYWKNHLVSKFTPPFWNSISPVFDPISLITWKNDLEFYETGDAFSKGKILNASKTIMQKNDMKQDENVKVAINRISWEVLKFLWEVDFLES